ncbi:MAG TPA: hypothetical protein VGS08_03225 [Candidatus Saccharimonadales bacterium]|nr:hypothetical protein [Candidatus Saccharimonadales bacterium]
MKAERTNRKSWHQTRIGALALSIAALFVGYLIASRAIDTGSLQQYFLTLLLVLFIGNRLIYVARPPRIARRSLRA